MLRKAGVGPMCGLTNGAGVRMESTHPQWISVIDLRWSIESYLDLRILVPRKENPGDGNP